MAKDKNDEKLEKVFAEIENKNEINQRIKKLQPPNLDIDFRSWKKTIEANFPELVFPAEVALSIICQLLINDVTNPFALVLVDVPSSGKTIVINFFDGILGLTYATDKFSPAAFVSGAANVSKEKLADVDLLPRLRYKMFLIRDLATLFSKRADDLSEALGLLTRVLDGEGLTIDTGTHGSRGYTGEYLFMVLAASTPVPHKIWSIMSSLGSRLFFLNMNTKEKSEDELTKQISNESYKNKEFVCRDTTKDFLYGLWQKYPNGIDWDKSLDAEIVVKIISRCARLLSKLRGTMQIWKPFRSQDDEYQFTRPIVEKPDRINQLFYNLCRGHALAQGRNQISEEDLRPIIELAIHSAPTNRADLFVELLEFGGRMKTDDVMKALNCSRPTALVEMRSLEVLGLCDFQYSSKESMSFDRAEGYKLELKSDFRWFVSDECKRIRKVSQKIKKASSTMLTPIIKLNLETGEEEGYAQGHFS